MAIKDVRATAAALAVAAGTASSLGQTWQGGYSPNWNDYQNWQPQQLPGPTSDVIIPETAGQVTCYSMGLLEIQSIDCRSGLYLFNTILKPSGTAYVKNLIAGQTRAGGMFTLDGNGQLGTHVGPGPHQNLGTYTYGTAWIQGTEFRNSGTIEGYSLGVMPDGQTPGVLKNTGTIKLGMAGFGGSLTGSGQGSHILNQGTIVKPLPETVTLGGGDGNFPGFIQESGAVAVQAGVLYCSGHTTWEGGTVSIASGAIFRLYGGGGGPHYFFGLPAISGQGTLLLEPGAFGFSGGPIVYAKDLTLQMGAPGKAVWGGTSHHVGEATLTNDGDVEWTTGGFSKVTPQSQALIRNQGTILIPPASPGVSSGVDLVNTFLIDQNSSLNLPDGATLTNQGLLALRRGSINGSIGSRVINKDTIDSPADAAPEVAVISVSLDMDGGGLTLASGAHPSADFMLTGGGVWKNSADAQVGEDRELLIPGGEYLFQGPGNRLHGTGIVRTYWSQAGQPTLRVDAGGTLRLALNHPQEEGAFEHRGGWLGGDGLVRNEGLLYLFGGTIGVDGVAHVENHATIVFAKPTPVAGEIINTHGCRVFQGWEGSIYLDGTVRNEGLWWASTAPGEHIEGPPGALFHNTGSFTLQRIAEPVGLRVDVRFNNDGGVWSEGALEFAGPVDQLQAGVLTGGQWYARGEGGSITFPGPITTIGPAAAVEGTPASIPALAHLTEVAGTLWVKDTIATFPDLATISGEGKIRFSDGATLHAQTGLNVAGVLYGGKIISERTPEAFLVTPILTNSGRVVPGDEDGAAIIDLTGAYEQNSTGRLEIELGGLTPGMQHDVVEVSGQAALAGTLEVALIDDFVPSVGDAFTILTAGSITGTFDTLDLPALPVGRTWQVHYSPGSEPWVLLSVVSACYPDCNQSGTLTIADFGCFQSAFVTADPYADCSGNGALTVADFACFQTKFAAGCP